MRIEKPRKRRYGAAVLYVFLSCLAALQGAAACRADALPAADAPATNQLPTPPGDSKQAPPQGFLWNISSKSFSFRIRRVNGPSWTEIETLAPGEKRTRRAGDEHEIFGLTPGVLPRFVVVRYPAYGGVIEERLSSRSGTKSDALMPYHFVIDDGNGEQAVIQVEGLEQAEAAQKAQQSKKPTAADNWDATRTRLVQSRLLIETPLYHGFGVPYGAVAPWALGPVLSSNYVAPCCQEATCGGYCAPAGAACCGP